MPMTPAPLFTDVHAGTGTRANTGPNSGPVTGKALWAETSDGKRIRLGIFTQPGDRGTVLLFPGRTEYIEKYAFCAAEFAQRGLSTLIVDWRGQGLADRLIDDPLVGHVEQFQDYQKDVATLLRVAREQGLPRPFYLLAHSMGGCIGLRAVIEGLPVQAAAFTGPMWGISLAPHLKPAAHLLSMLMPKIGKGHLLPPGTVSDPYVLSEPFENNMLTTDQDMFLMMRDQLLAHPELALGGPSYLWLHAALIETKHLASRASPTLPCTVWLGSNERIVHVPRIHQRMQDWKGGTLEIIEGAEHEVLMEGPDTRKTVIDQMTQLFLGTPAT